MTDRDILRDAKIEAILREFVSEPIDHERNMARKIWAAASEAGAVPALTPSPGLRRAYQEVFNGAAPPAQPEKQAALAVGRVRHFQYSGIARNGFSQEPELFDGAPILPDGALLYAYPPAPSQQAGADAPTRLMQWHDGAGLLWDVYAFGKWLHRVVSPLNWDAHAVYLDLQRAGYASHIDVQLVSPSNTAAPAAQGDERAALQQVESFLIDMHTQPVAWTVGESARLLPIVQAALARQQGAGDAATPMDAAFEAAVKACHDVFIEASKLPFDEDSPGVGTGAMWAAIRCETAISALKSAARAQRADKGDGDGR